MYFRMSGNLGVWEAGIFLGTVRQVSLLAYVGCYSRSLQHSPSIYLHFALENLHGIGAAVILEARCPFCRWPMASEVQNTLIVIIIFNNNNNSDRNVLHVYTVSKKKEATLIFDTTLPSVEIYLQFLKHFVHK